MQNRSKASVSKFIVTGNKSQLKLYYTFRLKVMRPNMFLPDHVFFWINMRVDENCYIDSFQSEEDEGSVHLLFIGTILLHIKYWKPTLSYSSKIYSGVTRL